MPGDRNVKGTARVSSYHAADEKSSRLQMQGDQVLLFIYLLRGSKGFKAMRPRFSGGTIKCHPALHNGLLWWNRSIDFVLFMETNTPVRLLLVKATIERENCVAPCRSVDLLFVLRAVKQPSELHGGSDRSLSCS